MRVSGLSGVVQISAGSQSLALLSNGTVMSWGAYNAPVNVPVLIPELTEVAGVAAGGQHSLAFFGP